MIVGSEEKNPRPWMLWICSWNRKPTSQFWLLQQKEMNQIHLVPWDCQTPNKQQCAAERSNLARPQFSDFYWHHNPSWFVKTQIAGSHHKSFRFSSSAISIKFPSIVLGTTRSEPDLDDNNLQPAANLLLTGPFLFFFLSPPTSLPQRAW